MTFKEKLVDLNCEILGLATAYASNFSEAERFVRGKELIDGTVEELYHNWEQNSHKILHEIDAEQQAEHTTTACTICRRGFEVETESFDADLVQICPACERS